MMLSRPYLGVLMTTSGRYVTFAGATVYLPKYILLCWFCLIRHKLFVNSFFLFTPSYNYSLFGLGFLRL